MWELSGRSCCAVRAVTCPAAGKGKRQRVWVGLRARSVLANGRLGARCALMEHVVIVKLRERAGNAAGLQGGTNVGIGACILSALKFARVFLCCCELTGFCRYPHR